MAVLLPPIRWRPATFKTGPADAPSGGKLSGGVRDGIPKENPLIPGLQGAPVDLLAVTKYNPASATAVPTNVTSLTAVDSTNLTISFMVPTTGKVIIRFDVAIEPDGNNAAYYTQIGLLVHGTSTQVGDLYFVSQPLNAPSGQTGIRPTYRLAVDMYVTGLTGGTNVTWDVAHISQNVSNIGNIRYGGAYGPALILAYSAV
jgi:hypothetical protein